jgi:hypothetical protein
MKGIRYRPQLRVHSWTRSPNLAPVQGEQGTHQLEHALVRNVTSEPRGDLLEGCFAARRCLERQLRRALKVAACGACPDGSALNQGDRIRYEITAYTHVVAVTYDPSPVVELEPQVLLVPGVDRNKVLPNRVSG